MKKITEYFLQINTPGDLFSDNEGIMQLESATPFVPPSKGDLIQNRGFKNPNLVDKGKLLRVTSIEHMFADSGTNLIQRIYVNTEEVDDTDELRES